MGIAKALSQNFVKTEEIKTVMLQGKASRNESYLHLIYINDTSVEAYYG